MPPEHRARQASPRWDLPWWLAAILVLGALGVLSLAYGALLAPKTLLGAGQHMNGAARVWARYAEHRAAPPA